MVESVSLLIRTKDHRSKEIPLTVWQVGAMALELGLQVNFPNLDDYKIMEDETLYHKRKKQEICAMRYFYGKVNHAISQILEQYIIESKEVFYLKKKEDAELDAQIKKIQKEFGLTEEFLYELVEDILK